ncbi:MAG: hypothetical protein ABS87_06685 [Sphingomonas sp. SCN 67-18]|uniref:PilZ domain-containing protein n=1 Tax=uncultured Sphingomonas sp. TaxID=158754 RepID=UPI00086F2540|nr:PilZ domain-containing protein [Sphingomonas sp. SCN 67-18]ODU21539.1 MAG: hypothetical protein ABS87_06685 [Sphingomonas sp. SCN 67-18]
MSFANRLGALAELDQRGAAREEVFYRTRCTTPRFGVVQMQVVNISACGFMARTEADFAVGDIVQIRLPVVGSVSAEIRWALGGRVGGQFDRMIDLAPYLSLLAELVRGSQ